MRFPYKFVRNTPPPSAEVPPLSQPGPEVRTLTDKEVDGLRLGLTIPLVEIRDNLSRIAVEAMQDEVASLGREIASSMMDTWMGEHEAEIKEVAAEAKKAIERMPAMDPEVIYNMVAEAVLATMQTPPDTDDSPRGPRMPEAPEPTENPDVTYYTYDRDFAGGDVTWRECADPRFVDVTVPNPYDVSRVMVEVYDRVGNSLIAVPTEYGKDWITIHPLAQQTPLTIKVMKL